MKLTEEEYKNQVAKDREIDALQYEIVKNRRKENRSLEEIKEAVIIEIVYHSEHSNGLRLNNSLDAFYNFEESLMCIFGTIEADRLHKAALKRIESLREKYPLREE